jgi:hypothetical protein
MNANAFSLPLFPLGRLVATPGAIELIARTGTNVFSLIRRHQYGDRGVVCQSDRMANNQALIDGTILSPYELGERRYRLWALIEADTSATTSLRPGEY